MIYFTKNVSACSRWLLVLLRKRKSTVVSRRSALFCIIGWVYKLVSTSTRHSLVSNMRYSIIRRPAQYLYESDQVMKAVDKDGDGEISKEEFVTHAFESDVIRNIL